MSIPEDTQPNLAIANVSGVAPPPPLLFYGILFLFVLMIITPIGSIIAFREILRPGQQQRVVNMLPFMEAFLPPRPSPGDTLPTPMSGGDLDSVSDSLLSISISTPLPTLLSEEIVPTVIPTSQEATLRKPATPSPAITPTMRPSAVPSVVPTEITALSSAPAIPTSGRMYGFRHEQQTWNNCGPASITIALSYYGWPEDQEFARRILRPDREDKNVTPDEMVAFVNAETNIRALWRMGGSLDMLRLLIANEFPVIIGTGYMPEGYDWLGHYQTVVGFDPGSFYIYDSFIGTGENGEGYARPVAEVDREWQHFNRRFIVLYPPDRGAQLLSLLGDLADPMAAAAAAFETAQQDARTNPRNGFAWFNIGTSLVALGQYQQAALAFDQARQVNLPWRMLWYQFGPYEAYYNIGRYSDVTALVQSNLNNGGQYVEETFYWQGMVYAAQGQTADARNAFRQVLSINPNAAFAQEALNRLG